MSTLKDELVDYLMSDEAPCLCRLEEAKKIASTILSKVRGKINKDTLLEIATPLLEKHFPKGECRERGAVLVFNAEMIIAITAILKEMEG